MLLPAENAPPSLLGLPPVAAGRPEDSGISLEIIQKLGPEGFPVFGVCMGHQCIGQVGHAAALGVASLGCKPWVSRVDHDAQQASLWAGRSRSQGAATPACSFCMPSELLYAL